MKKVLFPLALLGCLAATAEIFEMKARPTLTPVELNEGDVCRFTLLNGETRTVEYVGTESSILEIPATEGLIATLTMRLKIDGVEIPFRRYFATQESFYEPAVVNGLRIFPDSTLEYLQKTVPMRYPAVGAMRHHPWKDCRIVLQDATLKLCPERLHPWFLDKRWDDLLIPIGDAYHGGDCWLGPFGYGHAHGGMDICMKRGSLLYAPFALDTQYMPLYAKKGRGGTSRWRGLRRWADGTLWSINTSHVIDAIVDEHMAITNGQAYCTAAGTATGEFDHTHFELHVCRDLNAKVPEKVWDTGWGESPDVKNDCSKGQPEFYNLDPWMIIWQTFVQLRDERGLPVAEIAPFGPGQVGVPVRFRSARPIPRGCFAVWTFNDGTMHVGAEVEHTFGKEGVYVVTLTVTNGKDVRVRDINHITIGKGKPAGQLLGVKSDDVSFIELRPGDLPAWGEKVRCDPYSVRNANDLAFFDRVAGNVLQPKLVRSEMLGDKLEHRVYSCGENTETVEVLVRGGCNPGKVRDVAFKLDIGTRDFCYFHTPCFWVQHQFSGKRRWSETSGARDEKGQFVRFMPRLRGGLWRVEETLNATHAPGSAYWVKVRARDGEHRIRLSPLKDMLIGEFEFDEGEGYVQIDAEGSVGPVYIGALRFTPIKLEPPKYITESRLLELTGERKKIEQEIRDIAKTAKSRSGEPFRPADWLPATRALEKLPIGDGTVTQFFSELTVRYDQEPVIFGSKKEWEEFIMWIYCRCWALDLKDKWYKDILNRPFKPLDENTTETGRKLSALAKRLKAVTAEIEGL